MLISKIEQTDNGFQVLVQHRDCGTYPDHDAAKRVQAVATQRAAMLPEYGKVDLAFLADTHCVDGDQHKRLGLVWGPESEDYWLAVIAPAIRRGSRFTLGASTLGQPLGG